MKLTRYEQETIINFIAEEKTTTLYTRAPAVIRKFDSLVTEYPDTFKRVGQTDIDKTYSMPKSCVSYRKPRRLSEDIRNKRREILLANLTNAKSGV